MAEQIVIEPITRIEGHARISLLLDEGGRVAEARFQVTQVRGFEQFFANDPLGIPVLVWIFAVVAAGGWVLYNRTTFGRRTIAIGGPP